MTITAKVIAHSRAHGAPREVSSVRQHEIASSRKEALSKGIKRYSGKCHKHGEVFRWASNATCSVCTSEQVAGYRVRHKKELVESRRRWDRSNPVKAMLQRARRRARELDVPFGLTPDDITIPDVCPVLGVSLERHGDSRGSAPSIDRIIGEFGYVKGNVRVISHRANKLKSDATLEEMRLVLAYMEKYIAG